MSIKQIFKGKGEKFFRMEEKNEVLKLLKKKNCVIALGGGAFMDKAIRYSVLKKCYETDSDFSKYTDEAQLLENNGYRVKIFENNEYNKKITTKEDLNMYKILFKNV